MNNLNNHEGSVGDPSQQHQSTGNYVVINGQAYPIQMAPANAMVPQQLAIQVIPSPPANQMSGDYGMKKV
jgi:hypothetical protein